MSIATPETNALRTPLPGTGPVPVPSPVYVDGIPVQLATPPVSPAGRINRNQDFWSSVPRPISSNITENLYVSLPQPKTINYLTFDLAHFPQQFTVSWLDSDGDWNPVLWSNGTPMILTVTGSVPLIVNNSAALASGLNPYHYGAGHWDHFDEIITPVTTTQLQFSGIRAGGAQLPYYTTPIDAAGNPSPYPLGIRDLDFGYRILQREDVPYTPRSASVVTERQPFTQTTDVHGSPMTASVRENRASDLLAGTGPWCCSPQLRSDAIVNLYADCRTPAGQPQVIDGFKLDPVTSGVKVNLYYAPEPPPPGVAFSPPDTPLVSPAVQAFGTQLPQASGNGLLFANGPSSIQISAQAAGITGQNPWWVAAAFQPQFPALSTVNFLSGQNSGFEGGIGNWGIDPTVPCTVAPSTAFAHSGSGSLVITSTGAGNAWCSSNPTPGPNLNWMPVTANQTLYGSAWFLPNLNFRVCRLAITWWTAQGGTFIGGSYATGGTAVPGVWMKQTIQGTTPSNLPAGAVARLEAWVLGVAGAGEVYYLDDAVLSESPLAAAAEGSYMLADAGSFQVFYQNGTINMTVAGGNPANVQTLSVNPYFQAGTLNAWTGYIWSNLSSVSAPNMPAGSPYLTAGYLTPQAGSVYLAATQQINNVTPNTPYTISTLGYYSGGDIHQQSFQVDWYTSTGTYISSSFSYQPLGPPLTWNSYTSAYGAIVSPGNAAVGHFYPVFRNDGVTALNGADFAYITACQLTTSAVQQTVIGSWTVPFVLNDQLIFSVVYDGQALHGGLYWQGWQQFFSLTATTLPPIPTFGLANSLPLTDNGTQLGPALSLMYGNYLLTAMAIGQQLLDMSDQIDPVLQDFAAAPATFVYPFGGGSPPNVAVRFAPEFILPYDVLTPAAAGTTSTGNNYAQDYDQLALAAGPIAYYALNDAAGSSVAADSSGNGHNGTPTSVTFGAAGVTAAESSGTFNGTSSHITLPFNVGPLSAFSVDAWINFEGNPQTGNNPRIVANSHSDGADRNGFELMIAEVGGAGFAQFWVGNGSTSQGPTSAALPTSGWIYLAGTWDGTTVSLYVNGALVANAQQLGPMPPGLAGHIAIGYNPTYSLDFLNGQIERVGMYSRCLTLNEITARYAASPVVPAAQPVTGTGSTTSTSVNPWGFVGGITTSYEMCTWVPLCRDFSLARGLMEFDPVLASAFKFEFTSLAAEPFDFLDSVPIMVQSAPVNQTTAPLMINAPKTVALDNGLTVNQALAPSVTYADVPPSQVPYNPGSSLPRQVIYASTPAGADAMAQLGSLYNFQQFKTQPVIPVQVNTGVHVYGVSQYTTHSRIAFFVAISSITMYRTSYQAQDDTEEYTELFSDQLNYTINANPFPQVNWSWSQGQLTTGSDTLGLTGYAQVTSQVFPSDHTVTGVQFATTQSEAIQLLPDPDFSQPGVPTWVPIGDVTELPPAPSVVTSPGTMVVVTRAPVNYTWATLQAAFTSWALVQAGVANWSSFFFTPAPTISQIGGIQSVIPQPVTGAGRIYAAVRVFSPVSLTEPLALQILDGATGAVLAEEDNNVQGGVVTEWFAGYTIGTGNYSNVLTWSQVQGNFATWNATAGQFWNQIDLVIYPLGQTIQVRLIQRGVTNDTWHVDNLSVFEDSIVWSFSNDGGNSWYPAYDIRNNPSGVVLFGSPLQGTGNQLMWRLQGYRPDLTVTSLAIRPWYSVFPHGVPGRPAGVGHGPNVSPLDHYPPIMDDPRWQAWDQPIPQEWYFAFQQLLLQGASYVPVAEVPVIKPTAFLGSALAITAASQAPPPPPEPVIWEDILVDVYTDTYGIAAAGDVYTDVFDDTYASDYIITTGTVHQATAALTQGTVLSASGTVSLPVVPIEGASLGYVGGQSGAISSFITTTGQPLNLRRIYMGNTIPSSLASSVASYDAGLRKVFFDFQPDATTTPVQLANFLASCQAGGLAAEVSLWTNPNTSFTNPSDFFAIAQQYVPVIQGNGYDYVFVINNNIAVSGGLQQWWPGAYCTVNGLSVGLVSNGASPGDGGNPNLVTAASWADFNGVPFGLAEFGADWSKITVAQGVTFLTYVRDFFKARIAAGKPVGDLVYLATGTFSLPNAPAQWVTIYNQISAMLAEVV